MAALQQNAGKTSRLQTRLAARYQTVITEFQENVRGYNARLDKEQMGRLEALKEFLQENHSECEKAILYEIRFVDSHQSYLDRYESALKHLRSDSIQEGNSNSRSNVDGASESHVPLTAGAVSTTSAGGSVAMSGDHTDALSDVEIGRARVLEPFTDHFHKVEVDFTDSMARMESERQRLLSFCVALKNAHDERLAFLTHCDTEVEACESTRRDWLRRALKELVESLTKVGYASIGASHVLAQQAIHSMNEHLCRSHVARKSLLAQLRCREVLRQRRYSRQVADLYISFRKLMINSTVCWATTLLRTAHFRRPRSRAQLVERMGALTAAIRRDGEEFVDNVATTVRTLRHERDVLPSESGQMCGGTQPDGWLRGFDGGLFAPVFSSSPADVVVEWRVKANVLVRNVTAQCVNLSDEVSISESRLCGEAQQIEKELLRVLAWICTPCTDEVSLWRAASTHGTAAPESSTHAEALRSEGGNSRNNEAAAGVDDVYACFTHRNNELLNSSTDAVVSLTTPLLAAIQQESDWFVSTVRAQTRRQHMALEGILLRDPENLLQMFQWATGALERTATHTFGFIRERLVAIQHARLDHNDALRHLDDELAQLVARLRRAAAQSAADRLFADGLAVLRRIADAHTDFHRATVDALAAVARDGPAEAARRSAALRARLGLEGKEACEQRLARERAEAAEEASAAAAGRKGRAAREAAAAAAAAALLVADDAEGSSMCGSNEAPDFPLVEASDASMYYIVAPLALLENSEAKEPGVPTSSTSGRGKKATRKSPSPQRPPQQSQPPSQPQSPQNQQQEQQQQHQQLRSPGSLHLRSLSTVQSQVVPEPDLAFMQLYESLIRESVDGGDLSESALDALTEWRAVLRMEILNWTVALCAHTTTLLNQQCADAKSAVDAETNSVMRNHRRRSATLQADTYESRVRDLANVQMTESKMCTRLLERITSTCEAWNAALAETDANDTREAKLFDQLRAFERSAAAANSIVALQIQEQEFTALITASTDERERRKQEFTADMAKQQDSLEADVRAFLDQCGRDLPEDLDGPDALAASNGDMSKEAGWCQAIAALKQLRSAAQKVRGQIMDKDQSYDERLDAARGSYATVYEQNVEELTMLARLQDVHSRLKLQVHSMIVLSESSEAKLEELASAFEEQIASPVPECDLVELIHKTIQRHIEAAASHISDSGPHTTKNQKDNKPSNQTVSPSTTQVDAGGAEDITEERAYSADAELHERLSGMHAETQRDMRSSDAAKLLHLLDELRAALYVRGRQLDCLQYGVELFHVPPENYIEPRLAAPPVAPRDSTSTAPAAAERRPRGKAPHSPAAASPTSPAPPSTASAALFAAVPLPEAAPATAQVAEWVGAARAQAGAIADAHFAAVAPPLLQRRLPGMAGGAPGDVTAHTAQLCDQQQARAAAHIQGAAQRFRELVRRVRRALDRLPTYLMQTTYALSAAALERRLDAVFGVFADFYGKSDARRRAYDRLVKVTLATSHNRDRVVSLNAAERARQDVTRAAIERFWGYALRELEDEAAMHAARALNTNHTAVALTRGLVAPEHLRPCDDDDSGTHRGLRRLMRLRDRESRARELQEQVSQSAVRRERRLQETMPRHRHEDRESRGRRGDGAHRASVDPSGTLPLLPQREVEHTTVPLQAFRPLTTFSAQHPTAAMSLVNPSTAPVPSVSAAAATSQTHGHGHAHAQTTGGGKRTHKESKEESDEHEKAQTGGTVTIVAPATLLHKETAELTQRSVNVFNSASKVASDKTVDIFNDWAQRESTWKKTWAAAIQRLES